MYCHQCGSIVSDDSASCGACGAEIRAPRQPMATQAMPVADSSATLRMTPLASVPVPGPRPLTAVPSQPVTAVMSPTPARALTPSASRFVSNKNPATAVLLGGIAALMLLAWSGYQWSLRRAASQAVADAAQTATSGEVTARAGLGTGAIAVNASTSTAALTPRVDAG